MAAHRGVGAFPGQKKSAALSGTPAPPRSPAAFQTVLMAGLEPARRMAMEPKSIESTNSTTPAYSDQYSTPTAVTQAKIPAAAEKSPPAAKKVSYFPETVIQYKAKNTGILRDA